MITNIAENLENRISRHTLKMMFEMITITYIITLKYVKVILYSYLILKKMNERITDS